MIKRRGFLSLLGLGAAGLLVPTLPKILVYEPEAALLPVADTFIPVEIQSITQALAMELDRMLDGKTIAIDFTGDVGDRFDPNAWYWPQLNNWARLGSESVLMTDQLCVQTGFNVGAHDMHKRYIEPAAYTLAHVVKQKGLNTFFHAPVPDGDMLGFNSAWVNTGTVPLRGVQGFHPKTDELITRFDLIGGHA